MESWGRQFHDAHEAYSDFVRGELDLIADKLEAQQGLWCLESKEKDPKDHGPFYSLVSRLNTVSGRLRRMVTFPTTSWKTNIYTSSWVLLYMAEKPHQS